MTCVRHLVPVLKEAIQAAYSDTPGIFYISIPGKLYKMLLTYISLRLLKKLAKSALVSEIVSIA